MGGIFGKFAGARAMASVEANDGPRPGRGGLVGRLMVGLAVSWLLLGACGAGEGGSGAGEDAGGPVRVVVTFSVLGHVVERVAGEDAEVRTLVGPNGDTHAYTPSPADQVAIAQADVVFENGLGYEVWLDRLLESSGSAARRVVVTDGLEILMVESGAADPHVWLDVQKVIGIVETVRAELSKIAPSRAAEFERRATRLTLELEELDEWIFGQVETIPVERRKLVTGHESFGHFARRYGLEIVGAVIPSVTDDIVAPTAAGMAALVDLIREEGVTAVFAENVSSSRLAEQVAREAGVRLVEGLYTEALGEVGSEGETYEGMMRSDVRLIVEALGS